MSDIGNLHVIDWYLWRARPAPLTRWGFWLRSPVRYADGERERQSQ